jgi:hypothetical protein
MGIGLASYVRCVALAGDLDGADGSGRHGDHLPASRPMARDRRRPLPRWRPMCWACSQGR